MPPKSFLVKVELTVQKITCPGVWLCSNGKVSLQLCMLDSTIQTDVHKPSFPIISNEKFIFYKSFLKEKRLNELHRSITREWFCVELIQWKNCDEGVVLASFRSTLDDLLYPNSVKQSQIENTDVDLLLEPTKLFPGTISPKLELQTKTTIEETFCKLPQSCSDKITSTSLHKLLPSSQNSSSRKLHPRSVCHTVAYSRAQQNCPRIKKDKRPIFMYKRPEDDLILRTNPDNIDNDVVFRKTRDGVERKKSYLKNSQSCYCGDFVPICNQEYTSSSLVKIPSKSHSESTERNGQTCPYCCDTKHKSNVCSICSKYQCTFNSQYPSRSIREFLPEQTSQRKVSQVCSYCQENYEQSNERCPCVTDSVSSSEKKVCFCLPKERTCSLAQRLHDRLINTMQTGASGIENCIRNCEVCE